MSFDDKSGVIFSAEWNSTQFIEGLDKLIDGYKRANQEGTLTAETLQKLETGYAQVGKAASEMQKQTGKAYVDNKNLIDDVQVLNEAVLKGVELQKKKLADLKTVQDEQKKSIEELNGAIKANDQEYKELTKQLTTLTLKQKNAREEAEKLRSKLNEIGKSDPKATFQINKELDNLAKFEKKAGIEADTLSKQIKGLYGSTTNLKSELSKTKAGLVDTTDQIKIQNKVVKQAETASNGFISGINGMYGGLRKIAYLIPGIGMAGLISMISGPLITAFEDVVLNMDKVNAALKTMQANYKNVTDVVATGNREAGKQIADLKILYSAATDVNKPMKERLSAVKALQAEFPDYFKNIKAETILNGDAEQQYLALAKSIVAVARAKAAKGRIDEIEAKLLDIEFQKQKIINATDAEARRAQTRDYANTAAGRALLAQGQGAAPQINTRESQLRVIAKRRKEALDLQNEEAESLQAQEKFLIQFVGADNLTKVVVDTQTKKIKKAKKEIENIYQRELQKLKSDIEKINAQTFTSEETITRAVEEDFKRRALAFEQAFHKKQLTKGQLASLKENLQNLQDLTLNKELSDFAEKRKSYLKSIADELQNLQDEESLKRISLLQDDFERERQTIEAESLKTLNKYIEARDKRIAELKKNAAANGVTDSEVKRQINEITAAYANLIDSLELIKQQKLQKLSFDTFERLSEDARRLLDSGNLGVSEGSLVNIQKQAQLYQAGKISYSQYQKELTKIARFEAHERYNIDKLFLQQEIERRQERLSTDRTLTEKQIQQLKDEIVRLKQQLANATKSDVESGANEDNSDKKEKIDRFIKYAHAIGDLTQAIIGFWQKANEAELESLDKSIALQNKRVDAAQRIADRGNASYLKMEEERLKELELKRENAARRQLAVNAAIQASSMITALVTGIAQAVSVGGPLGAILGVTAVLGAIAAGFAIVKSLQPPTPTFFVGTEDTGQGGNLDSKGGFAAVVHPHERVVAAEENKELKGISNKKLVEIVKTHKVMVENYRSKPLPQLNLNAVDMANNVTATHDIKLASAMQEIAEKQEQGNAILNRVHKALKNMGTEINFDKRGVAITVYQEISRFKINKKL